MSHTSQCSQQPPGRTLFTRPKRESDLQETVLTKSNSRAVSKQSLFKYQEPRIELSAHVVLSLTRIHETAIETTNYLRWLLIEFPHDINYISRNSYDYLYHD